MTASGVAATEERQEIGFTDLAGPKALEGLLEFPILTNSGITWNSRECHAQLREYASPCPATCRDREEVVKARVMTVETVKSPEFGGPMGGGRQQYRYWVIE